MFEDVRYAIRILDRSRGVSLLIILMLAVGIGSTTAIFSAVDALILRPFSFPNQERLVTVHERKLDVGVARAAVAPGNLAQWKAQSQTFEELIALRTEDFDLRGSGLPERYAGYRVSAQFFHALGVEPMIGRGFRAADGEAGREQVVILKHSLWQKRFSSDRKIIDQTINLNGQAYVVIGVMAPEFNFPVDAGELWTPLVIDPAMAENRGAHYLRVIGLLKPGASVKQAGAEIRDLMKQAEKLYPATNSGVDAYVTGLNEDYTRDARSYLSILITAVLLVLAIACANAANLLLVRASSREREMAIRLAVGASRFRLIRQLLAESMILSLLGAALALVLAKWGVTALVATVPIGFAQSIPGWSRLGLSMNTLAFSGVVAVLTAVLFGLVPAWQTTKTDVNRALKEGGRGIGSSVRARWRHLLVVVEVALSIALLIGSGLLIRSFVTVLTTDFGFDSRLAVSLRIVLPKDRYATGEQRVNFVRQALESVRAIPGVLDVGAVDTLPLSTRRNQSFFQIVGQPPFPPATQPRTQVSIATTGYLETVRTPLRAGRLFTNNDQATSPAVAVVNEAFAHKYFPGREAIGESLSFGPKSSVQIIGRVANVINDDLDDAVEPGVYQPYSQLPTPGVSLVVRTSSDPTSIVGAITNQLAQLDSTVPVSSVMTLDEIVRERATPKRAVTTVLSSFAAIAMVLATIGLYGVISFAVAQRTHELGVRMALGAQSGNIFALVLGQGMKLILVGLVFGIGLSLAFSRVIKQMLYGVESTDPLTLISVVSLFVFVGGVACCVPAIRATRVNPLVALRHDKPTPQAESR